MRILLHGCTGHMGKVTLGCIEEGFASSVIAAQVSPEAVEEPKNHIYTSLSHVTEDADCLVDFSHHSAIGDILNYCIVQKLPAVIATTGHTEEEKALIQKASASVPVFFSANMSVGIALLADMAKRAAAAFPSADIEIVETHHNRKLDVPSGTALLLARRIQEARPKSNLIIGRHENGKRQAYDIGIHSIRLGNEVGRHEIIISTGDETFTLKHEAENRRLFATGALTAASYLTGKSAGLYDMQSMFTL